MKKFRVTYIVRGKGFKLGEESIWLDSSDFEDDMDEIGIMEIIHESVSDHFAQHYYPTIPRITPVVEQIKQYLQGENNELA